MLAAVLRLVSGTPLQFLFAGLGDKGNVRYFGIEIDDLVEIAQKIDIYSTDSILQ